jgi:glutamine synthetase
MIESQLPHNLGDAARKMRDSKIAKELFGAEFVDHYSSTRLWEWNRFQRAVTTWELERYFELA